MTTGSSPLARTLDARLHERRAGQGRMVDRWCRRLLHGRLRSLDGGAIAIADARGTNLLGAAAEPTATITVHDPRFYRRVVLGGAVAAADAFIEGQWTCDDLTALLSLLARETDAADTLEHGIAALADAARRLSHRLRANTPRGSRRNILSHYDLGNDFFSLFLDETMTYSSGVFERPDATLEEASIAKIDRICRKLDLRPEHRLLEIGSGWGSFAIHAARTYGCRVVTTTISEAQHALAGRRVREAGVDDRVTVLKRDYRDLQCPPDGAYDRIVSIEMIEAVGHRFLGRFFETCTRLLAPDGMMALQAITMPDQRYAQYLRSADFIRTHIFPGSNCPSMSAMLDAVTARTDMRLTDVEDVTPHYAETLARWRARFLAERRAVRHLGYPDAFLRLWHFYLAYCEAGFREHAVGCVQMLLARPRYRPALAPGTRVAPA